MLNRSYTIKIMPRGDGGLRIRSDDAPGLILSGPDPVKVIAAVLPALEALADHGATAGSTQGERK